MMIIINLWSTIFKHHLYSSVSIHQALQCLATSSSSSSLPFSRQLSICVPKTETQETLTLTQSQQTFTVTFREPFSKVPAYCYCNKFIESGNILSNEFAVTHLPALTSPSSTQLVISFELHKGPFTPGQYLTLSLVVTDDNSRKINFGVIELDLSSLSLTFSGFSLDYAGSQLQVYPLALPMNFTKGISGGTTQRLVLLTTPVNYYVQGTILFSYLYLTNAYSAEHPVSLFQAINQQFYGYLLSYSVFAYSPSTGSSLLAVRTYSSTNSPFFPLTTHSYFIPSGTSIDTFLIGYTDYSAYPLLYTADVLLINSSYSGCPTQQFLYYVDYFSSLPLSCAPCALSCLTCLVPNIAQPATTNESSCQSCSFPRYLDSQDSISGRCRCYPGLNEAGGVCESCEWQCLTFEVVFIELTNQTNFLLYYSYQNVVEKLPLEQNLQISLNGRSIAFTCQQQSSAVYVVATKLEEFEECGMSTCEVLFLFEHPQKVLLTDLSRSLSNNNKTLVVENFVNYYSILPESVQKAFTILSMIVAGSFGSGYTSLLKILFELEQLIDAHKYLNLNLPVIFNQLVESLQNFKFMDLSNLLPSEVVDTIRNIAPNNLDQMGPPKLIYYDQGVNFIKNIITGIMSVVAMLVFNLTIYLLLRYIPLKVTRKLAKKIHKRRIITIHDTLEQLELPVFIFAMAQLHTVLLVPALSWVYGAAMVLATVALVAPLGVVMYIWEHRGHEQDTDIYEDLMQDNDMTQPVTFIYYVFNYFRKIFFALCLTFSLPGLIQIYLLITLNTVHLAFQLYLVVSKVYLSKSKVVIRLVNSVSVIAVEVLILVYNLGSYENQTNINIGMACFYLSITTAILGIVDAFIKLLDTIFQEISTKRVETTKGSFPRRPLLPQFRSNVQCQLGQELVQPKHGSVPDKFQIDKELIENTFPHKDPGADSENSEIISKADATKSHPDELDLVFIDDDWTDIYPPAKPHSHLMPGSPTSAHKIAQEHYGPQQESKVELYEIPAQIDRQARKMRQLQRLQQRQKQKGRKEDEEYVELPAVSTKREGRGRGNRLHVRPIRESNAEQISELDPKNP